MVEANHQRENILPSERAFSYKMQLDAMRRQGKRTDLTSRPLVEKSLSVDEVSKGTDDSSRQIHRYIRLTELAEPLLQMVDDRKIAFRPAVELSYLPQELQKELLDVIEAYECTPSLSQAQRMKQAAQDGKLNRDGMELVMQEEKPQQNNITIKSDKLSKYFPKAATPREKEELIIKALDYYCKVQERKRQEREHER
jgi:ParB family chromosome partitioning protein